jgi:hypothetical protein
MDRRPDVPSGRRAFTSQTGGYNGKSRQGEGRAWWLRGLQSGKKRILPHRGLWENF